VSDTTLTSKGQTTIPKGIRDELGIRPGDRMTFTLLPDGTVIMRVKNRRLADAAGALHREGEPAVPVEQMTPWR
jgi:AbrB family looped-hinge helix DNA binding protein